MKAEARTLEVEECCPAFMKKLRQPLDGREDQQPNDWKYTLPRRCSVHPLDR